MKTLLLLLCSLTIQIASAQKLTYKISSDEGKCRVAFPAETEEQRKDISGFNTVLYVLNHNSTVYLFSYSHIPVSAAEEDMLIQATKMGFLESVNMVASAEKAVKKGKTTGLYTEGHSAENNLFVRYEIYYTNGILYQIGLMQQGSMPDLKQHQAFTKSFKMKK
jgi:hypothetical protein